MYIRIVIRRLLYKQKKGKILIENKDAWIELQKLKLTQNIELFTEKQIAALNTAIKGLKQLIPQPVKTEYEAQGGCITCFEVAKCPNCDVPLDDISEFCDVSYCLHCGQALDWEGNENE